MKRPIKRFAYILGILLIMAFVFVIIYSNYQANIELRNRSFQRAHMDFLDTVSLAKNFLSERQKDFHTLALDRTIETYFANKAMGMTMMYGLAISLNNVKKTLTNFQHHNLSGNQPIFPQIVFLDNNKQLIKVTAENYPQPIDFSIQNEPPLFKKNVIQHDPYNPSLMRISEPCIHKEKEVGQLIGWIPYTLLLNNFFQAENSSEHMFLFADSKHSHLILDSARASVQIKEIDIHTLLNDGHQSFTNPIDHKIYLIFNVDDSHLPFEAVKLISSIEIYGTDDPEKLLIRMISICVLLFFVTVILLRLSMKDQIYAVKLVDAEERRKKIEQKNKELEIAHQKAADANLKLQQSQKEIQIQNERLRELDRLKSEFLANMSHEIRTPMNGVIGMADILRNTKLTEDQHRYVDVINSSAQSLLIIINDILDFSKIEANRLELETIDFDLQTLLDDIVPPLALNAHERGLELTIHMASNVSSKVRGDPARLRQILTNLIGNALKFTSFGEVSVRVFLESESAENIRPRFVIRDTGIGIPLDRQASLFDHFTQVDTSHTRQYGGTGLGLAICKRLSEMMGGEIGVSSAEGKGSEFWFTINLEKQAAGESFSMESVPGLAGKRALIVDDNMSSQELLTDYLKSWNMHVDAIDNGFDAIQMIYKAININNPFNIALIDMQMPGLSGEALGRAIKHEKRLNELQIILLITMDIQIDRKQLERIGFSGALIKPVKKSDLKKTLTVLGLM